jgi:hypothetical protein
MNLVLSITNYKKCRYTLWLTLCIVVIYTLHYELNMYYVLSVYRELFIM